MEQLTDLNPLSSPGFSRLFQLRALHGCPPLELDVELARNAQAHSEKMANENVMHHCLSRGHGENLCIREGSQPTHID
ncbi:hypothetical protein X801_06123, partial [Opisthorchis viverrini]